MRLPRQGSLNQIIYFIFLLLKINLYDSYDNPDRTLKRLNPAPACPATGGFTGQPPTSQQGATRHLQHERFYTEDMHLEIHSQLAPYGNRHGLCQRSAGSAH